MRMTNKIMRNNSLYNINQNKILEDSLSNQMTTQSKISRPSDDPVVAIRALRLRTNVTTTTQYSEKNVKDAEQWLSVTSSALDSVYDVLNNLYEETTTGANKYLTSDDLQVILTQLKELTEEFYSCGNVDYAGRYVFSGYRTDTSITFSDEDIAEMEKNPVTYEITENMDYDDISTISYTDYSVLTNGLESVGAGDDESYEQYVTNTTLYRLRLSYAELDSGETDDDGNITASNLTITLNGVEQTVTEYADAASAYAAIANGTETGIAYIPSTGELVFSGTVYSGMSTTDSFEITYSKSSWSAGDLNPVHYFACTKTAEDGSKIAYNTLSDASSQDIYYDVGFNQQIQVNTTADEVFIHAVQRDYDDLAYSLEELQAIEKTISDIEDKMEGLEEDSEEYLDLQAQLEAAEKAQTYIQENLKTKFQNQITKYQNYMDQTNVAETNCATRESRLTLIGTRLTNQLTTFEELQDDNESIDISEIAVELTSAELTYQAALMSTSKIMQTNLLNYL